MPVLSIITINFNNKAGLERTIKSVVSQTRSDFEFIIIDGGSTDGSVELTHANKAHISCFISEKDKGIYDAQNKGIKKATGNYLLFLNSGDAFYSNTVVSDFYDLTRLKNYEIVYGNTNILHSGKRDELLFPAKKLSIDYFFKYTINHQACFIARKLFSEFGLYDTQYKVCADFDFFVKVFVARPTAFSYYDKIICNYEYGGLSSNKENYELVVSEKQKILRSHLPAKEYGMYFANFRKTIPLKYRILERVYKIPFLNLLFQKLYNLVKPND